MRDGGHEIAAKDVFSSKPGTMPRARHANCTLAPCSRGVASELFQTYANNTSLQRGRGMMDKMAPPLIDLSLVAQVVNNIQRLQNMCRVDGWISGCFSWLAVPVVLSG